MWEGTQVQDVPMNTRRGFAFLAESHFFSQENMGSRTSWQCRKSERKKEGENVKKKDGHECKTSACVRSLTGGAIDGWNGQQHKDCSSFLADEQKHSITKIRCYFFSLKKKLCSAYWTTLNGMCALLSVRVLRNLNLAVVGRLPGLVFSVSIITSNLFQHVRTLHTCPHQKWKSFTFLSKWLCCV